MVHPVDMGEASTKKKSCHIALDKEQLKGGRIYFFLEVKGNTLSIMVERISQQGTMVGIQLVPLHFSQKARVNRKWGQTIKSPDLPQ